MATQLGWGGVGGGWEGGPGDGPGVQLVVERQRLLLWIQGCGSMLDVVLHPSRIKGCSRITRDVHQSQHLSTCRIDIIFCRCGQHHIRMHTTTQAGYRMSRGNTAARRWAAIVPTVERQLNLRFVLTSSLEYWMCPSLKLCGLARLSMRSICDQNA